MRILVLPLVFPSPQRPGEGIFILRCAEALRELGHELAVVRIVPFAPPITPKWRTYSSIPARYTIEGIPVRTIRAIIPPRRFGTEYLPLQVGRAVRTEVERFKADVIHANFLIPCGQIAVRQRVPSVVTAHGGDAYDWSLRRAGLRAAAREAIVKAARVTAVSHFIRRCVETIAPCDVEVIWNGGDERFFFPRDREAARAELGISPERFVVAFAGNLLKSKGVYDLLAAAVALGDVKPLLLIAGDGPEHDGLSRRAAQDGVELQLLGRLEQSRLAGVYAAADVTTLPSYNEGLPNVVCEGMLCGRVVVASAVGGIPEVIDDNRTGLLVEPGNVSQLRDALAACARNPEHRQRIEAAAHRFAAEHLTWRKAAVAYERVFAQAVENPSG